MIRIVHANDIDKKKWDERVIVDANFEAYALSSFLDTVTQNKWSALIDGDYETVMPFVLKNKFGVQYVTMPNFTQKYSVFGNKNKIKEFMMTLRSSIKFGEINQSFHSNLESLSLINIKERTNFILVLNRTYEELFLGFSENHQRNVKKYKKSVVETIESPDLTPLYQLCKEELSDVLSLKKIDQLTHTLKAIHDLANEKIQSRVIYANTPEGIIGGAFFLETESKIYYLIGASKKNISEYPSALFGLLDYMINKYSSSSRILDFEGSDIPGVGRFFKGFGARNEKYLSLKWNDLPFYLKWFKR